MTDDRGRRIPAESVGSDTHRRVALCGRQSHSAQQVQSLLQLFEFSYPDGHLFLDRGGLLCRRLRDRFPHLAVKSVERIQLDMQTPDRGTELYFGIRTAAIQQVGSEGDDFGVGAAEFARILADTLELSAVESFRYQQIIGKPCASIEAALALMRPLIAKETQDRLGQRAAEAEWRSVQAEFRLHNLLFLDRIAVLELAPHTSPSSPPIPHVTVQFDVKGLVPVPFSELDIEALVGNMGRKHRDDVIARIAPHLSEL